MLVLWGAKNVIGTLWNVFDVWREHAHSPVEGLVLECKHFLVEENPDEVLSELLRFFGRASKEILLRQLVAIHHWIGMPVRPVALSTTSICAARYLSQPLSSGLSRQIR